MAQGRPCDGNYYRHVHDTPPCVPSGQRSYLAQDGWWVQPPPDSLRSRIVCCTDAKSQRLPSRCGLHSKITHVLLCPCLVPPPPACSSFSCAVLQMPSAEPQDMRDLRKTCSFRISSCCKTASKDLHKIPLRVTLKITVLKDNFEASVPSA